jgi:hypothetical protein
MRKPIHKTSGFSEDVVAPGVISDLVAARESLSVASEKLLDPVAKEFTSDMLKVTDALVKWAHAQS